ncbi:ABC transporter permease subunit [Mycolicibacterium goodii]|uniref:ABC transporter permease subunit n=1 Tax=Mycolicibacterium goodii TaxID=134601 RepID=UPI000C26BF96|nr:hypothetical protein CSX11_31920 [Mycolicibacterium goodii]
MSSVGSASVRERDFLVAARVSGLSWWTIVRRHIFPNVLPATLTYALSDAVLVGHRCHCRTAVPRRRRPTAHS